MEDHENFPHQTPTLPFEGQESKEVKAESESIKTEDMTISGNAQLQALSASSSPETLERAVEAGLEFLGSLGDYFNKEAQQSQDSAQWLQQIGKRKCYLNSGGPND
jgi:hypothetical protein